MTEDVTDLDAPDTVGRHRLVPPQTAAADDTAVEERLLGRPATLRRRDIARDAGVSLMSARKFWHALGFPVAQDEDLVFTEADASALRRVVRLVREDALDEATALSMTRAFARTADRLAVWQTQLMAEALSAEEDPEPGEKDTRAVTDAAAANRATDTLMTIADEIEPLLVYAWRRHLAAAVTRMRSDASGDVDASAPDRVVGFADLVNFTSLVRRMTERQLSAMVQRFERLASDVVVAHGGRVIKTVGDEVLFVHHLPGPAAAIAVDLVDAMAEDPLLPEVRVGMAYGPVLSRMADVFGVTVNRASRLTSVTPPGRVYVDDQLGRRLASISGFDLVKARRRNLRGIGPVAPSELSRAGVRRDGGQESGTRSKGYRSE